MPTRSQSCSGLPNLSPTHSSVVPVFCRQETKLVLELQCGVGKFTTSTWQGAKLRHGSSQMDSSALRSGRHTTQGRAQQALRKSGAFFFFFLSFPGFFFSFSFFCHLTVFIFSDEASMPGVMGLDSSVALPIVFKGIEMKKKDR